MSVCAVKSEQPIVRCYTTVNYFHHISNITYSLYSNTHVCTCFCDNMQ